MHKILFFILAIAVPAMAHAEIFTKHDLAAVQSNPKAIVSYLYKYDLYMSP
jgi:hypothetical protein